MNNEINKFLLFIKKDIKTITAQMVKKQTDKERFDEAVIVIKVINNNLDIKEIYIKYIFEKINTNMFYELFKNRHITRFKPYYTSKEEYNNFFNKAYDYEIIKRELRKDSKIL